MSRYAISVLLLSLVCLALNANALTVKPKEASVFLEGMSILPRSVQLTNKTFCFFTATEHDQSKQSDPSALCSYDGGASVKAVKTPHRICTSGVVVDERLYCPHEELPHDEDGELEFSSVAYAVQDGELNEEEAEKHFLFKGGKQTGEVKQILFDGNVVHLGDDDDAQILVSTIINDAEERKVTVFKSEDGFVFKAITVIPIVDKAETHHVVYEGGRRLSLISVYNNSFYTSVSSGYAGSFWSAPKVLAVASAPASAAFSSGVLVQYACSNETSNGAKWYVMEDAAKRSLSLKSPNIPAAKEVGGSPLLLFPVASEENAKELIVVHDEAGPKATSGVRLSTYRVDDSTEVKEKADKIAKEREELLKKEAARFKARMERLERERAQRREQRRKEQERKRKFLIDDEPNVIAAKSYMEADGEMVIVRRVQKESIALEKEVFFSDL